MQEWIEAIESAEWLLGFAMGIAGKRIANGAKKVLRGFTDDATDTNDSDQNSAEPRP